MSDPLNSVADIAGHIPPGSLLCYFSFTQNAPPRGKVFTTGDL